MSYKHKLPREMDEDSFSKYIFPYLSKNKSGPEPKIGYYKTFSYILRVLHTGIQWNMLEIDKTADGKNEIHYTTVFKKYSRWSNDGSLAKIFDNSIEQIIENDLVDPNIIFGDGSINSAYLGGDDIGFSGHKHKKGNNIILFSDVNSYALSFPYIMPANASEVKNFKFGFKNISRHIKALYSKDFRGYCCADGAFDSISNRKHIFNSNMIPNIPENKRNRKQKKTGRMRLFCEKIQEMRDNSIERLFAWVDSYRRLKSRYEKKSTNFIGFNLIALALINLRKLV